VLTLPDQSQDCSDCGPTEQLSKDFHKDGMVSTAFVSNGGYNV